MLYVLQIIVWQNIFELSLLCYTYYKSLHDKIYLSCHYYVIHTANHCMTKYIWVVSIMLYVLQIIVWQNIFELSLLCYTYCKSLYDKIYLSCQYYVIRTTNHCMRKYIRVVIIMLYISQIIVWQNIFELSVLCYTYYESLYDKIYLSCHCYVIHTTNHCMTKYIWVVIIMLYILQIIVWQNIFELSVLCYTYDKSLYEEIYSSCHYYVIHITNYCMTKYIGVVIIMLYVLQIIVWGNIFELSLLCYTNYKSFYDKIYSSCHYYVIHTTNHCMTKYIWVVIIMLYILQIIVWKNIFELSLLCYTYYKSLYDKTYLSCHYYIIHTTNHCMTKYIWVVIIMLYILQIIIWKNIFELSLLCYTYYKSLYDKTYLSCQYYVIRTTNHCMTKYIWVVIIMLYILQIIVWQNIFELSVLCYTYYKSLYEEIYSSCHYYVIHITNYCMTKYIRVVSIMLYILQIIAWQNIFELSLLCQTYYKSLYDKTYLSCHYYVIHTTNHCMTKYIWVVIIMLYILQIIVWKNIFELSLLCYTYYKSLYDKTYLSCQYYVIRTTNHCMTKHIWVVSIMLYVLQIIVWQNIFELSLLCYTYYESLYDKIYLSCQYYVIRTMNHCMTKYIWVVIIMLYILQIIVWQNIFELSLLCYTYCKSLYDKIYLSCQYYVIRTTNHCMRKYIRVVIIMLYISQIIVWQNIFELSLLCYTYYKSLYEEIYLSCHYYVIHNTNHCMRKYIRVAIIMLYILQIIVWQNIFELSLICYTYYKSLYDKIYLSCHYYVICTTNHCMTKHIWVVIIMLYILQIIAWQNIFELSLICYTYYKSLYDKIYLSCHYYVIHTTNHCMTKYIWVVSIMLYVLWIIVWQNIFELSLLCYTYYKSLYDKIYLSCHYYVIHTANHCMTKYIWVVSIMLYVLQIIVWGNIFELSLLCYTYHKSLYDKI